MCFPNVALVLCSLVHIYCIRAFNIFLSVQVANKRIVTGHFCGLSCSGQENFHILWRKFVEMFSLWKFCLFTAFLLLQLCASAYRYTHNHVYGRCIQCVSFSLCFVLHFGFGVFAKYYKKHVIITKCCPLILTVMYVHCAMSVVSTLWQ